jgi:drug/metabolite transporter (DMT)-like permease
MGIILLLIGMALVAIGYRVQTELGPNYGWIMVLGVLCMGFGCLCFLLSLTRKEKHQHRVLNRKKNHLKSSERN